MSNLSQRNWETISIPSRNLDFMWTICIINSFRCIRDSLWFAPHRSMANKLGRTCGESWIFTVACQEEFAGKIGCSLLQSTECYCSQLMRPYMSMNEDDLSLLLKSKFSSYLSLKIKCSLMRAISDIF